jgi:hypothetical protein
MSTNTSVALVPIDRCFADGEQTVVATAFHVFVVAYEEPALRRQFGSRCRCCYQPGPTTILRGRLSTRRSVGRGERPVSVRSSNRSGRVNIG